MVQLILNRITVKLGFRIMADNRGSQNVMFNLRSSAINCVFEIVWKAKICNRNVNYNTTDSAPWLNAPVLRDVFKDQNSLVGCVFAAT